MLAASSVYATAARSSPLVKSLSLSDGIFDQGSECVDEQFVAVFLPLVKFETHLVEARLQALFREMMV
jgi:hypothetical protein